MAVCARFENYEVLQRPDGSPFELGRGAMGVTYKARDLDLHCEVALKVINPGILDSAAARERFLREARAAAQLRHPNIASVYHLGKCPDETHFYAMEFCEGPTLEQAIAANGPLPAVDAIRLTAQVCRALVLAEQHHLVHRDLKPANLILTQRRDEGTVIKVIDFGLAKSFADDRQLSYMSTCGFVGTAHFASPEQIDEQQADIRSDIFSLGACLWFMLTGGTMFHGGLMRVMSQMAHDEPPWDKVEVQPAPVVALLRRMLAKDREQRPQTAMALGQEINACLSALTSSGETRVSFATSLPTQVAPTPIRAAAATTPIATVVPAAKAAPPPLPPVPAAPPPAPAPVPPPAPPSLPIPIAPSSAPGLPTRKSPSALVLAAVAIGIALAAIFFSVSKWSGQPGQRGLSSAPNSSPRLETNLSSSEPNRPIANLAPADNTANIKQREDARQAEAERLAAATVAEEAAREREQMQSRIRDLEQKLDQISRDPATKVSLGPPVSTPSKLAPAPLAEPSSASGFPAGFEQFILSVWSHNASNNEWEWAGDFAEHARYNYAPNGTANRAFIAEDRRKLIHRYPKRHYANLAVSDENVVNDSTVRLRMTFNYAYVGAQTKSGRTTIALTCERQQPGWRITAFDESVARDR